MQKVIFVNVHADETSELSIDFVNSKINDYLELGYSVKQVIPITRTGSYSYCATYAFVLEK